MNRGLITKIKRQLNDMGWSKSEILTVNQTADLTNTLHGISTTSPGTANTKTAWADLVASVPYDSCILIIHVTAIQIGGSATGFSLDIATGGAGSETVLIDNILWHGKARPKFWYFPIRIAAGTRLAYRYQVEQVSQNIIVGCTLVPDIPEFPSGTSVITIGGPLSATGTGVDNFSFSTTSLRDVWQYIGANTGIMQWAIPIPGIRSAQNFISNSVGYIADWGWSAGVDAGAAYGSTVGKPDTVWAIDQFWVTDTSEASYSNSMAVYLDPPLVNGHISLAAEVNSGNQSQHGPLCYGILL